MGKKLASDWNASFVESSAKQNEVKNYDELAINLTVNFVIGSGCDI